MPRPPESLGRCSPSELNARPGRFYLASGHGRGEPPGVISGDTVERVRHHTRLAKVIGERVKLQRRGNSFVGLCPFHNEKTPSFHVNDERGFYYCFGCQAKGDAISFLRETEGLTFAEAVRSLAERAGIEVEDERSDAERTQAQAAKKRTEELYRANDVAAAFFEECLQHHELAGHALGELERRGLTPEADHEGLVTQTLTAFRVGYAPNGWDGLARRLESAGINPRDGEAVGLLAPRKQGVGHYDRFRHRLMFAVMDLRGRVIAFSGRSLPPPPGAEETGEAPAKYINSPESPIYKKREAVFGLFQARQAVRAADRAIVVEGNFDVVSLHARGFQNVLAPLGTAFTTEQAALIKRYSANVCILFDGDAAGRKASRAAREPCQEAGVRATVCSLPAGADPDDLILRKGPRALQQVLDGARGMLEYLIDGTLDADFMTNDAQGRAQKLKEVTDLIASEDDPTVRAMAERHADAIATRLGISDAQTFRALKAAVHRAATSSASSRVEARGAASRGPALPASAPHARRATPTSPARAQAQNRRAHTAAQVVSALLLYPDLLAEPEILEELEHAQADLALSVAVLHGAAASGNLDPQETLERLPDSLRDTVTQHLVRNHHETRAVAFKAVVDNMERLRRGALQEHARGAVEELHRASAEGDLDAQDQLLRDLVERTKRQHKL